MLGLAELVGRSSNRVESFDISHHVLAQRIHIQQPIGLGDREAPCPTATSSEGTVEISMWLPSRFALLLNLDTMAAGILCKGLESERLAIQCAASKHKKHRNNNNK